MQMEEYLYQPLEYNTKKPSSMSDEDCNLLDKKALGDVRLCLISSVAFNISRDKTTKA